MKLFEQAQYARTKEDWVKLLPWNIFKNQSNIPVKNQFMIAGHRSN